MEKIKEMQLNALDVLGKRVADLDTALDGLAQKKNPFDAEAQVYFIRSLAKRLHDTADRIHGEMHTENSADHPHICDQTSQKGVFDFIFGKGIL